MSDIFVRPAMTRLQHMLCAVLLRGRRQGHVQLHLASASRRRYSHPAHLHNPDPRTCEAAWDLRGSHLGRSTAVDMIKADAL